jgi:antitoxin ParD1/3/4
MTKTERGRSTVADIETMDVALAPEFALLVREAVASGEYASASEVVADALRDWRMNRSGQGMDVEELRRLWQEGIASGQGRYSSIEEIIAEAQRRFEMKKTSA